MQNCIFGGCSNLGKVENFLIAFFSIDQFATNTIGIVFKDISKLLMSNVGWYGDNAGSYQTLQGTFDLVGMSAGFCEVYGSSIGLDVSSNPTITGDALIKDIVFLGTLTTGKYINGYTVGGYTGYNFNNRWNVNSPGVPIEGDGVASGDINFDYPVGSGASTTISGLSTPVKLSGTTTSNNLYRFSNGGTNNKLIYLGTKRRYFRTAATFSFQSSVAAAGVFVFYLAKNGVIINQSKVYCGVNSSDIDAATILSTIDMATNDYIEVWVSRFSGAGNVTTVSLNLVAN